MLRKLLDFLNKDLSGRTWTEESEHPYFGPMILFAQRDNDQSYWECEVKFDGETLGIGICAPDRSEPSNHQLQFVQSLLADPDGAFNKASPILVPEFQTWHRQPFPKNWREAFRWVGFMVPAGGKETNPWEISYESLVDAAGHHFTCYFEDGKASRASVDG